MVYHPLTLVYHGLPSSDHGPKMVYHGKKLMHVQVKGCFRESGDKECLGGNDYITVIILHMTLF